jgi:hypothetical protein
MGFDKRNPGQKPLSMGLSTSPKAGTVSKPFSILRGGASPPKGPPPLESPKLRELGGDGFSVIRTVPGVNALLAAPPMESNEHFGRFMDHAESDDNASLTSNRHQFGGVASRLSGLSGGGRWVF